MTTRARKRKNPDVLRIGRAVSYPGIDPRSWVATGRVDPDDESFRWEPELGWIADVSMYGGMMDGVNEVPCRTMGIGRGDDQGEFIPPDRDCEVLVGLAGGDVEQGPVIMGTLTNKGCKAPTTINGLPIIPGSADFPSTEASVSPFDTEIKKSPHNRREEYAGDLFVEATNAVLKAAEKLQIGSEEATEPFIKGNAHASSLNDFLDALTTYATSIQGIADPSSSATPKLTAAIVTFKTQLAPGADLSEKVLGE